MAEETSRFFRAELGQATAQVEDRFQEWAKTTCDSFRLSRHQGGKLTLYAAGRDARSVRTLQNLLRSLTKNTWKLPLGDLPRGWLVLLQEQEFAAALGENAPGATETAEREIDRTHTAHTFGNGRVISQLSAGFDARSKAMLEALRTQQVC